MGWALVFSGQGHQHPAMLPWLARDTTIATLEDALGADWRERLSRPEEAGRNLPAQVLLTATGCAAWAQLQPLLQPPAIVAGYSVGELAAFAAAGVFDAATAVSLAARRAEAMDRAAAREPTGLIGVTAATPAALQTLCERFGLEVAIRIDAGSAVLGGRRADLRAAEAFAVDQGWRCTPLNIAMASHTHWMSEAAQSFGALLSGIVFGRPAVPLCTNARGRVRGAADARDALAAQLARTVRWDDCMAAIVEQGVSAVLEVGPGRALANLWQERHPQVPARSADEFRSAGAVAAWVNGRIEA